MIDLQAPNINGSNDHDRLNQVVNYIDLLHRQIELGAFDSKTSTTGYSQTDSGIYAPKKYVDELYVRKNQGSENENKILKVNQNGILSLVDFPSSGKLNASFLTWTPQLFTWDDDTRSRTYIEGWRTRFRIATIGIIDPNGGDDNFGIVVVDGEFLRDTGNEIPKNTKVYLDTKYMFSTMDLYPGVSDPINFRCFEKWDALNPLYRSIRESVNFKCDWEWPDPDSDSSWYSIINEVEPFSKVFLHGIGTFGYYEQTDV